MTIDIPGREPVTFEYVVLDFNGTLAVDGQVTSAVEKLLKEVASRYATIIATADTFGTAKSFAERLAVPLRIVQTGQDKEELIESLKGGAVAIGNGVNDERMFVAANLAVAIMGPEGAALQTLLAADIVVPNVERALELLIHPNRLVATLRE